MSSTIPREDPLSAPSTLKRLASKIAMSDAGMRGAGWYLKHVVTRLEPALSDWTRGRVTSLPISPVVFLETLRGRRTPLTYFTQGDDVILIASNFGRTTNPSWYRDVKANPQVTLRAAGRSGAYVAREALGAEREELWALAKRWTPPLARYEEMAGGRTIPVIRCKEAER
ncbi:MAG TPA: nitroreductase family deazaflavin-dependent oxidoreductase [Candidatus Dormibacteraeota bacterium]|nr:nitroreductase family deazaflavin-dependent oxidoreductase [Candidatus Dormibacteraeota bacterium]HEX2681669.1 nitroreductase family deazaflavin-dependent oxidoreductase [Candidatus Dormibacteraeota bacterium]